MRQCSEFRGCSDFGGLGRGVCKDFSVKLFGDVCDGFKMVLGWFWSAKDARNQTRTAAKLQQFTRAVKPFQGLFWALLWAAFGLIFAALQGLKIRFIWG